MFIDQLNSFYPKTSTTKMAGRKASLAPVRFKLKKKTDVEEPTPLRHFAEHRHLHGHPHEDIHRPCAPPLPSRSSRRFPPSTTSPSSSVRLRTACAAPSSLPCPGVYTLYAFRLDIQRGTAIVHLAGKGAKEAAAQCFSEPRLDFESQAGACQLELVNASKHLGTHAVFNASSQRAADGKAAYVPLKHCVFDSRHLPLRSNIEVATATLWSERLYRAVTWSALPASARRRLDACLCASAPLVRSRRRFRRQALPGHHVRCFTRHLSVAASARFAGRRCLSRLITALVTLLHLEGSWDALVFQRLRWQQHVASESVLAADHDDFKCGEAQ